jgi:hypothetical protein
MNKMEGIEERSARRRRIIVTHVAKNFADAEQWDLEFWLSRTPQERLEAVWAINRDIELVKRAKKDADRRRKARG